MRSSQLDMQFPVANENDHRELNVQILDTEEIGNNHEWHVHAQTDISFRHIVEENLEPRADAIRFKLIADINVEASRSSFSRACSSTTLFKVPATITCDRTFARDAYEAYYLNAMHGYLYQVESELKVEYIPFLKYPLHSRYFCAFSRRPIHFNEHYERRRLAQWVPGDSPDLSHFSDLQKVAWFPKLDSWSHLISQPSALPVPTPCAYYFFQFELRNAERFAFLADSERIRRLRFCAQHEYYLFFLSTWWNEVYYGGKAFVIKHQTINILDAHCGTIPDISGKPAQAIIERMRMFADMPQSHHNWISFSDRCMESCAFIFAVKRIGVPDHGISSGRQLWCHRDHRGVTVSQYSSRTHRKLDLFEQRVAEPDLDSLPGLVSVVRDQGWTQYTSIRVGDLLHNLLSLYVKTHSKLDEERRNLSEEEKSHDRTNRDLEYMRKEVEDLRRSLDDRNYRVDETRNQNEKLRQYLDNARFEIDGLRREQNRTRLPATEGEHTPRGVRTPTDVDKAHSPHYDPQTENSKKARFDAHPEVSENPLTSTVERIPTHQVSNAQASAHTENDSELVTVPDEGATIPAGAASNAEVPKNKGSPQRRRLRKIKQGYPFHSIPKPTRPRPDRSAQTRNPDQCT